MTMPIRPGPWAFLGTLGEAANAYASVKENMRRQKFSEGMQTASTVLNMIEAGVLDKNVLGKDGMINVFKGIGANFSQEDLKAPTSAEVTDERLAQIIPGLRPQQVPDITQPLAMQTEPGQIMGQDVNIPTGPARGTRAETDEEVRTRVGVGTTEGAVLGLPAASETITEEARVSGARRDVDIARDVSRTQAFTQVGDSYARAARTAYNDANKKDIFGPDSNLIIGARDAIIESAREMAEAKGETLTPQHIQGIDESISRMRDEKLELDAQRMLAQAQAGNYNRNAVDDQIRRHQDAINENNNKIADNSGQIDQMDEYYYGKIMNDLRAGMTQADVQARYQHVWDRFTIVNNLKRENDELSVRNERLTQMQEWLQGIRTNRPPVISAPSGGSSVSSVVNAPDAPAAPPPVTDVEGVQFYSPSAKQWVSTNKEAFINSIIDRHNTKGDVVAFLSGKMGEGYLLNDSVRRILDWFTSGEAERMGAPRELVDQMIQLRFTDLGQPPTVPSESSPPAIP